VLDWLRPEHSATGRVDDDLHLLLAEDHPREIDRGARHYCNESGRTAAPPDLPASRGEGPTS
jgi:hypothetical protein